MADKTITITVPSDKVALAAKGYLKLYPNTERIADPNWVVPETQTEPPVQAPEILKYTDAQWIREHVRRMFVRDVWRGLQMAANEQAQVAQDDNVAQ